MPETATSHSPPRPPTFPRGAPPEFHVSAKLTDAICNTTTSSVATTSSSQPIASAISASRSWSRSSPPTVSARSVSPSAAPCPCYCRERSVRFACHDECLRSRFISTPDSEPGVNHLCAAYKAFFTHIDQPMRLLAEER